MPLVIDAQVAGISGDMMLCSLVHMGADTSKIESALRRAATKVPGTRLGDVGFEKVRRCGLEATALQLEVLEDVQSRNASELREHILAAAESENLSERAREFTASSMDALIGAESRVHGVEPSSVHLHEAASFDTVVDILGTAIALDDLDLFSETITCTPVAVGGGTHEFSHGTVSNPAGAILEILCCKNIEIRGGPAGSELTTPTGASILVSLASSCSQFYPSLSPTAVGYGAGSADHKGFSNVLKVVRGSTPEGATTDRVRILETNLDDVTGELMGHVIDALVQRGARDVTVAPGITKKGRPTSLVTVICDAASYDGVLATLIDETGTLGVRVRDSERIIVPRRSSTADIELRGQKFNIRYKTAGTKSPKLEHDDVAHVATALGITLQSARTMISDAVFGGSK